MDTNRKVFRNSSPTLGAQLRGVFGSDLNYFAPSLFRFEAKYVEELKPCHIPHRPIECPKTIPRGHLLNADDVIISNELVSNFEMEVPSLIGNFFVGFGNEYLSLLPAVRAFYPTGEPLLSYSKHILSLLKEAGIFYLLSFRGGEEGFATNIYANNLTSLRQELIRNIVAREAHIPLTRRTFTNGYCFNISLNRSRHPKFKPANIPDSEVFTFQLPASQLQSKTIIPIPTLESGKARLITILNSAKETLVSFVQTLKHSLENLRAYLSVFWKGNLEFRELFNLAIAGDRAFVLFVNSKPLLKSGIVELATEVKPVLGSLKGLRISLKTILEDLFHLTYTVFNLAYSRKEVKAHSSPALKCGVF